MKVSYILTINSPFWANFRQFCSNLLLQTNDPWQRQRSRLIGAEKYGLIRLASREREPVSWSWSSYLKNAFIFQVSIMMLPGFFFFFFFFLNILGHQTITFYISLNGKVPLLSYNQIWKFVKSKCFMLRKQKKTKGLWVDSSTVTIWFYNSRLANVLQYFLCKSFTFLLHFQLKSLN